MLTGVFICPGTAFAGPMRCAVAESSAAGGMVEVRTDDGPAPAWAPAEIKRGLNLSIRWMPPASSQSARLVVGYLDETLLDMGNEPSGGHIDFRISSPTTPDDTRVILSLPDGQNVTLQGDDLRYGKDDEGRPRMAAVFGSRSQDWPNIRAALKDRGRLGVKLVRRGEPLVDLVFDVSNREARDALLAQARRKVAAADPQVCTDAPRPVVRMY